MIFSKNKMEWGRGRWCDPIRSEIRIKAVVLNQGQPCPAGGHLAIPGAIFGCPRWVMGLSELRPGMLLDILQCPKLSGPEFSTAKVEKAGFLDKELLLLFTCRTSQHF